MKQLVRISFLVVSLVVASSFSNANEAYGPKVLGERCAYFVQRLIEDDYHTLLNVEVSDVVTWSDCKEASDTDESNPVYLFGLAIQRGLSAANYKFYDNAISLLREAADMGYEPAQFQLLRYKWREHDLEDAFMRRKWIIKYGAIKDDPIPIIDSLKNTRSETIRDYLLGYIVTHFVQKRFSLAKKIAFSEDRKERPKNILYLGIMYLAGWDVERDKEKGMSEIRRAAALGDLEAQYYYARHAMYYEKDGEMPGERTIDGYKYLSIAANNGHQSALLGIDLYIWQRSAHSYVRIPNWFRESPEYQNEILKTISCTLTDETRFKLLHHKVLLACAP